MASINCAIINPHYEELLNSISKWAKKDKSRKQMKSPYEAAFRLAERDFLIDLETLKYDTNQEILTKGRLNGFKKTLEDLNTKIDSGKLDHEFGQFFYQTSHYGAKDPIIGGYLKEMQNSSFHFRKNEMRDKSRFKEIVVALEEDAGLNSLSGKMSIRSAQKKLSKLDTELIKAINDGNDSRHAEIRKEINTLTTSGELKSFGDLQHVIEVGLKEATQAKYGAIKKEAKEGNKKSKDLLDSIEQGKGRVRLTDSEIAKFVRDRDGNKLEDRPGMYKAVIAYDSMMDGLYSTLRKGVEQRIDSISERMKLNGDDRSHDALVELRKKMIGELMPKYEAGFFPHYVRDLSAPFMQKMMPHLDDLQTAANPYLKNKTKTITDIVNSMNLDINEHAKGRQVEGDYGYSKHFLNVVNNYISDVNRFNFTSYVDSHFIRSMSGVERIYRKKGSANGYGQNVVDYITDLSKAANGDSTISPKNRALMRTVLGFEFISKLGVNPRSAARNFTQRLLDYVEWGPVQISNMKQQLKSINLKTSKGAEVSSELFIESALKDAGLLFDNAAPQLLETGLQSPASMFNLRVWNESKGKYEILEKSKLEKFADFTSAIAAKSSFIHRAAENSNRKHTFKIGFAQMYKWMKNNPQFRADRQSEWGASFRGKIRR